MRTSWSLDCDNSGSDLDGDIFGHRDLFFGEYVLHFEQLWVVCLGCVLLNNVVAKRVVISTKSEVRSYAQKVGAKIL